MTSYNSTSNSAAIDCFHADCQLPSCLRTSSLAILFLVTNLLCLIQTYRTIRLTKRRINYQLAILYLAILETLLGFLHWGFLSSTDFDFAIIYLKLIELLVLSYYFTSYAFELLRYRHLENRLLVPVFIILVLILTSFLIISIIGLWDKSTAEACLDPSFVLFDASQLLLSVLILIAGCLITWKLKKVQLSENIRKRKQSILWLLVLVFLITSLITAGWDIGFDLYHASHASSSCTHTFDNEWIQAIVNWLLRTIDLLVPLWAALYVFNLELVAKKIRHAEPLPEAVLQQPHFPQNYTIQKELYDFSENTNDVPEDEV
eukprot:TRINITY_DN4478_c0_g1_i2.p1 TRINITY_DN4478_c0_g1~~TRINITY_DN4478_c0_g1_i2.p1  ORF type:complete len:318 (+),score=41.95 TRINITY_DN4478_c0_g1_i2:61-1014(+)